MSAATRTVSASWTGDPAATSYTCTLMYGFSTPSTFTQSTTSTQCSFSGLAPGTSYGVQVVANNAMAVSAPVVAFATVPAPPVTTHHAPKVLHTITCVKGTTVKHVRALNPRCPMGFTRR